MKVLVNGWRRLAVALVIAMFGGTAVAAPTVGADRSAESMLVSDGPLNPEIMLFAGDGQEVQVAGHAHRYMPPAPRRPHVQRWSPYRSGFRFRVAPPRVFMPGWFGLYFLSPPAARVDVAPAPVEPRAPVVRRQKRDFKHVGQYSLGMTFGGYYGAYRGGEAYADPGGRLTLRYRNTSVVGAELGIGMYGTNMRPEQASDARSDMPIQLSALVHLFPRLPIQPYLLFGGTATVRNYAHVGSDGALGDPYTEVRVGPHVGLGVELMVGNRVGVTVDARRIIYTLVDRQVIDQTFLQDATVTGGLNFYF